MDAPARAVSGPHAVRQGAVRRGCRARAAARASCCTSCPSDGDLEQAVARRRVLPRGARRAVRRRPPSARSCRFRRTKSIPYRGMAPHFGVTSARARALHALASGTARVVVASAAALLPRVSAPDAPARRVDRSEAGPGHRAGRPRRPARRRRLHARGSGRRARRVRRPRRHRRHLPGRRRAAGPARVRRRHDRVAPHATTRRRSDRSSRSIRWRSCRCATCSTTDSARDALRLPGARKRDRAVIVSELDEVEAHVASCVDQFEQRRSRRSTREAGRCSCAPQLRRVRRARDRSHRAPASAFASWDELGRLDGAPALDAAGVDDADRAGTIRCQPARRIARPRRRLGRRDPRGCATRARRRCSSRRRPAAPSARSSCCKEYDVLAVPVERAEDARYAAVLVAVGALSRGFRLPDAGLQIYAEADVFEEERRAPERRRSATQGVPLGPPRPEGRRPRRPRRPRHRRVRRPEADRRRRQRCRSSSSCATPATTSCSCRSSGSISFRSTPARRSRRSIGSAARRGSGRRPRSRRPCATWPRSCSSSTPRARPCPATRSAPTRTGSRSSRTRSSTS